MAIHNFPDGKNLKTRYLVWLYKSTKEQLDKINRKFTQLEIDKFIFKKVELALNSQPVSKRKIYKKFLKEFSNYITKKENEAWELKFSKPKEIKPSYKFLLVKLLSVESAIKKFLGKKKLIEIRLLYQQEMVKRILEERQHK